MGEEISLYSLSPRERARVRAYNKIINIVQMLTPGAQIADYDMVPTGCRLHFIALPDIHRDAST